MKSDKPYSLRCVDAIAGLCGGRKLLAEKLGIQKVTIAHWVMKGRISPKYVLPIVKLGQGKFSAEELLGKYDCVEEVVVSPVVSELVH